MCAEEGVYVLWRILPLVGSVLRPVGEVARHAGGSGCGSENSEAQCVVCHDNAVLSYPNTIYITHYMTLCSASHTVLLT